MFIAIKCRLIKLFLERGLCPAVDNLRTNIVCYTRNSNHQCIINLQTHLTLGLAAREQTSNILKHLARFQNLFLLRSQCLYHDLHSGGGAGLVLRHVADGEVSRWVRHYDVVEHFLISEEGTAVVEYHRIWKQTVLLIIQVILGKETINTYLHEVAKRATMREGWLVLLPT